MMSENNGVAISPHERKAVEGRIDTLAGQLRALLASGLSRTKRAAEWAKVLEELADLHNKLSG
jgi:hypothetical protein